MALSVFRTTGKELLTGPEVWRRQVAQASGFGRT